MEGRMKKYRETSPERAPIWTEPSSKQQSKKVAVVYYLCRKRHLEHPHFIEVPLSSRHGLYLRDVIDRLNVLRGKGMAAMYSWSCKRNYKSGFVWHDLCEHDMILPAHGNEYILKGSELLEESSSGRLHNSSAKLQNLNSLQEPASSRRQEVSSSSSSTMERSAKSPQEMQLSVPLGRQSSSEISPVSEASKDKEPSWDDSVSFTEYRVYKLDGAADASTQTDGRERRARTRDTCTRGVSTDEGLSDLNCYENHQNQVTGKDNTELCRDETSPPPSSSSTSSGGKTETLESLIRADVNKINSFRILEEEQVQAPPHTRLKASNVLMQLISCGSITVKDHHSFGLIPTYRPKLNHAKFASPMFYSSMMLGELDCLSENPRLMGLRLEDKEYFSGSLIETKQHKEEEGEGYSVLKRSSSYNADRTYKSSDFMVCKEKDIDSFGTKCIPRTIKASLNKHLGNEPIRSPLSEGPRNSSVGPDCSKAISTSASNGGSRRVADPSTVKRLSKRLDSRKEEKLIKIEERLASGARVIIQSKACCDDSEGSSSS